MKIIDDLKLAHGRIQTYMQGFFTIHKGRMHRWDFFLCIIFAMVLKGSIGFVFVYIGMTKMLAMVYIIVTFAYLYFIYSAFAKRLRDMGFSGLFLLPCVILDVVIYNYDIELLYYSNLLLLLFFVLWPPQKKDNHYGAYDAMSYTNYEPILRKEK